jgi:hypothetical protein
MAQMLRDVFKGLQILDWGLLTLAAAAFFTFWARTRFWLPKYVHFLAALGLAIGLWCVSSASGDAPVSKQGPIGKTLAVLALPAMVYFFFVFYGGQRAAYERLYVTSAPCPYCKHPVAALRDGNRTIVGEYSYAELECPHCGQAFGG